MDPSPSYQHNLLGRAGFVKDRCGTTIANCESSTKLDCRKRKLSFQQPAVIPVINLEPEPAPEASSHIATGVTDDNYYDDDFFENLDLDAIEAEATALWRQKTAQSAQKSVETKKASDLSFSPPSFDLGF
jgi:Fanconi anemia group M protein